jgi:hypothetical protein
MTTNGSLVDLFKLVIAFQRTFDAKKVVKGIFEISVGNFIHNGCHVGSVGPIRRGLKQNSTLARIWTPPAHQANRSSTITRDFSAKKNKSFQCL